MSSVQAQVPGGGARAAMARELFGRIAPRYDLANRVLSGGMDLLWRRWTAGEMAPRAGDRVLDVCTGTGDLAGAMLDQSDGKAVVYGADFCLPMLQQAREKQRAAGVANAGRLVTADGLRLPYRDGAFDLVVASFGVRSYADLDAGIREMARVTRPGGRVGILEFSQPEPRLFRWLYVLYLRHLLPLIGDLVSGSPGTYSYLPGTVLEFPDQQALACRMAGCGLRDVRYTNMTFGVAALHMGIRG